MHAEVWGVLKAEHYEMNPTVAFVARHNGRLSRPCPDCVAALKGAGVKEVWYTYEPNEWRHEKIA